MAEKERVYERMTPAVEEKVRRQAREATREAGEKIVRDMVDRGFKDGEVRPVVSDGMDSGRRAVKYNEGE